MSAPGAWRSPGRLPPPRSRSIKPLTAHNVVEFTLKPEGDATTVTWSMKGDAPYFAKVIHVFFDMDSMVGTDFEAGLANLKALAEK